MRSTQIAVTGGREKWSYTLDEATQGSIAVRLVLGSGAQWCTGAITPKLPKLDVRDKFQGLPTPPPPACVSF
jgi:hypothetical protein